MNSLFVASVTHVHHIGLEVKIQIDMLREVIEKKPLVGAIIRRLTRWDKVFKPAQNKRPTGVALRRTLLGPAEKASFDIKSDTPRSGFMDRCEQRRLA